MSRSGRRRTEKTTRMGRSRIYWRNQGGVPRAYADLRDLGGGQVALIAPGEKKATSDPAIAEELMRRRLNEVVARRRNQVLLGIEPDADLASFAIYHVTRMHESGEYSPTWIVNTETYLARAVTFFTREQHASAAIPRPASRPRNLAEIGVRDMTVYMAWLKNHPNGRGSTLGRQAVRHHLAALAKLFKRAISEGRLPMGQNPVAAMIDRPTVPPSTTRLLEVHELALLIESARTLSRTGAGGREPLTCAYELIATLALTGIREGEARGMNVDDLNFPERFIEVGGTKTRTSARRVPMHPQLVEVLEPYVARLGRRSGPLFPGRDGSAFGSWTRTLDLIAARVGFPPGEVRTRRFRVSYATHRSTCDDVDPTTVRLELGHGSLAMMERVYARAQHRSLRMGPEMSFRVERLGSDHRPLLERLSESQVPADERRARDAVLLQRFLAATAGMSAPEVTTFTGIPDATVNRLRAGQTTAQERTLTRVREYLSRLSSGTDTASPKAPPSIPDLGARRTG